MRSRDGVIFKHFLTASNESNAFVLGCEKRSEAILIDAGAFEPAIQAFLDTQKLRLTKVFITHDHYDHTSGLPDVIEHYEVDVLAAHGHCGGCKTTQVRHGDQVRVGELVGRVLDTSGHTPDSVSLYFPGMVFTGDALFSGSVGGTPSRDAAGRQIDLIRKHIFTLPPDTEVHTGHGPSSTVAIESRFNPFFV